MKLIFNIIYKSIDYSIMALATFDFVIIGGGTAGLVVANRLTENPNVQVLVLKLGRTRVIIYLFRLRVCIRSCKAERRIGIF